MAVYEVEQKFPLQGTPEEFVTALEKINAVAEGTVVQEDIYFSHPVRDFRETEEAFRIRSVGDKNIITYKGPLLDKQTKTRQEIELLFESGDDNANQMWAMLRALGFRDVRRVKKTRRIFSATYGSRKFKITLDNVDQLGEFVEVETLANQSDWEAARDTLLNLAAKLNLHDSERRSYLKMLVENDMLETGS